jgi:hypothetical protein
MKVTRRISSTALLVALFVLVAHARAAAQQAASAAPQAPAVSGATVPASSVSVSSPSALPGPRLSPEFQRAEPTLARSTTFEGSSLAVASGQHTIVISTLALVLAVIIIVLLVAK